MPSMSPRRRYTLAAVAFVGVALGAATVKAVADPTPRPRPRAQSFGQEDLKRYQTPTPKGGATAAPPEEAPESDNHVTGAAPRPTKNPRPQYRPFWRPPTPDPSAGNHSETSPHPGATEVPPPGGGISGGGPE
jgi:hypothetical protein